jgi:hypothetical protein
MPLAAAGIKTMSDTKIVQIIITETDDIKQQKGSVTINGRLATTVTDIIEILGILEIGKQLALAAATIREDAARSGGTWQSHGENSGMRYPEECDLIGGETDCVARSGGE